ncbi:hypothetical protein COCNU_scaffold009366G000010 [Cocos nucifera]|nr:hypothetical protein [Cocos nucifera]
MPIWSMPALEPTVTTLSPILSDEVAPPAPVRQEGVVERKKKRAIGKKVGKMSRLEGELKAARDEATYFRKNFYSVQLVESSGKSEELVFLRRTIGELSKAVDFHFFDRKGLQISGWIQNQKWEHFFSITKLEVNSLSIKMRVLSHIVAQIIFPKPD